MAQRHRDWDASTYHQVSTPHRAWAGDLIARLQLTGDEVVLDAGCGSGAITERLLEAVGSGTVYAVDVAPSMVAHTRAALGPRGVAVFLQDLTELDLPGPVDAVFSSATFHWIADHPALFASLFGALKPGGRLVAQCGGRGNIDRFRVVAERIAFSESPFAEHFSGWAGPWNYAGPEETLTRLAEAGFVDAEAWLAEAPAVIDDPATYLRSVVLLRHLDVLPVALHDAFIDRVVASLQTPFVLDYVRLNLVASRPNSTV